MYEITCLDENGKSVTHLTQWDINQSLVIKGLGLNSNPEFHFCNKNSTEALVVSSGLDIVTDVITVKIPNKLLTEPYPIFAYIYFYSTGNSAKTVAEIKLPVRQRVKPSEYEYVENIDTVSAESIKIDILKSINSLNLKCEETDDNNYKISLFNLDGIEISSCELPISDVVESINDKINNFYLKSDMLDTKDFRVTLYSSDTIEITHCDITTSEIVTQYEQDIDEVTTSLSETNNKIVDIEQAVSAENYYNFYTDFMLELHPEYSIYTESYTHYTGDTYGKTIPINGSDYNPYNGDSLIVWVDYKILKMDTDYFITEIGTSNYAILFDEELASDSKIILQVWHKPTDIICLPNINMLNYSLYVTSVYDETDSVNYAAITFGDYLIDISKVSTIKIYADYNNTTDFKFRLDWDNDEFTQLSDYNIGTEITLSDLLSDMEVTPSSLKVTLILNETEESNVDIDLLNSFYIERTKLT